MKEDLDKIKEQCQKFVDKYGYCIKVETMLRENNKKEAYAQVVIGYCPIR